ncbi:MAG: hypothetical protein ACE5ER_03565, partial [Nitrospinaceae bacterium]
MENDGAEILRELIDEAQPLREDAYNGLDPALNQWREKTRQALLEFAAVKIPAFDEIRFASDFFLSQAETKQPSINDRIALACDLDLAVEILEQAVALIEEKRPFPRRRPTRPAASPETAGSGPGPGIEDLLHIVESLDLSPREKQEALEDLKR